MKEDAAHAPSQEIWIRRAALASILVALILIGIKLYAWWISDSTAILSSLIDSLMDAGASLINALAIRHALAPPDAEHRFGHGKLEALAGLAQSAFIAGSSVFLIVEAIRHLSAPPPIREGEIGIAVMGVSMALTIGLVVFQRFVIHRSGSLAIRADHLHYVGDLLSNLAVIAALVLASWFGWAIADPVFAIGIALYILWNAGAILRRAADHLMDRELPDALRAEIRRAVLSHPEVLSLHDLRTRTSGTTSFIQLHLVLPPTLTLWEAHRIADEVERKVMAVVPSSEVLVHQDPAGLKEAISE